MKTIIGILAILGVFFGAYQYQEMRYAKCGELKAVEQRLDYKIVSDQAQSIQQRIWTLEERYKGNIMPESVLEEYRKLLEDKKRMEQKMLILEKESK